MAVNPLVTKVMPGRLHTASGDAVETDEIVWVTRAGGVQWLRDTGLALDRDGFIRVSDTL